MNRRAVLAIARKDIQAITANLQVWLPMLVVPLILGVVVPVGMVLAFRFGAGAMAPSDVELVIGWVEKLPPGELATVLAGLPELSQRLIYVGANYFLAPFFLLIPLMAASVISADSFAGEKERGTLESLLFAPVDIRSLFLGKVLAALIPAVALSLGTFVLCAVTVNLAGWPRFGRIFFPQLNWLPLLLLVIPMLSLATILVNVFISARVATFQAAYQLGALVVLPVLALVAGQFTGVLLLDTVAVLLMGVVLGLLNLLLLRQVMRRLDRNLLFSTQVR